MPADDLTDPAPATTFAHLDATIVLERSIAELGIYPGRRSARVDVPRAPPDIVGEEHYDVARGVQSVLQRYKDLAGHHRDSRHGRTVARGQAHGVPRPQDPALPQPAVFSVAEVFTGRAGKQVPVADTVRGFKEILEGKHDDVAEGDFYMKGGSRKSTRSDRDQWLKPFDSKSSRRRLMPFPKTWTWSPCRASGADGHLPEARRLITQIVPGEVIVRTNGRDRFLAVGEGLVEMAADYVAIVTDMAVAADKIDEAKAEEARERAAARLREKISDEEIASVNASLARSLAQLHVKRRRRN